jgi:patatin-related protein
VATEVRCALALNGGVSLAIWIAGLIDELLRLVNAGANEPGAQPEYVDLCRELDVVPKIDVAAGTSAGGLNAVFLATALVNGCADLTPLRHLWIEQGAFSELLRDPNEPELPSLLRGDSWFLHRLREGLEKVAASGTGVRPVDPPLDIRLTATWLEGRRTTIPDGPASLHSVDHRVQFHFGNADFDLVADPNASARLARACRSTSSFPGAFEPSTVTGGDLYDARHVPDLADSLENAPAHLVDGGVLANLPAMQAVDSIIRQPSRERVERVLALIVPDPGGPPAGPAALPPLTDTVSQSAVGIPRNQSLTEFVDSVITHNLEVRSRRAARAALLGQFAGMAPADAWKTFATLSETLFPPYRAMRHRMSVDAMARRLAARLPDAVLTQLERDATDAALVDILPWVPSQLDVDDDQTGVWGGSPLRRLTALMVTWTNAAAKAAVASGYEEVGRDLLTRKAALSEIRAATDRLAPKAAIDQFFIEESAALDHAPEQTADALRAAAARWRGAGDSVSSGLRDLLAELAGHLVVLVDACRPFADEMTDPDAGPTIRGLVSLVDGAGPSNVRRLLLGLEVVEVAFCGTEPRPDQTIRLAQFSSTQPVTIDPAGRDAPEEKLAGVQLGHFAAFFKRSWRANDWMWGRLDAAERVVRLLDEVSGGRLATTGRLDHHLRRTQAAVLREMLPVVACEIEADGRAGGRVGPQAREFVDGVAAAGSAGHDGVVSLHGVGDDEVARLLALNRVGVERLREERGTTLASSTALTALATGTRLLRHQGVRGIRGPMGFLSAGSMAAWRWRRRSLRTRRTALALVAAVVVAAVLAVVDLAGADIGPWAVPAAIVLGLAVLAVLVVAIRALVRRREAPSATEPMTSPSATAHGGRP